MHLQTCYVKYYPLSVGTFWQGLTQNHRFIGQFVRESTKGNVFQASLQLVSLQTKVIQTSTLYILQKIGFIVLTSTSDLWAMFIHNLVSSARKNINIWIVISFLNIRKNSNKLISLIIVLSYFRGSCQRFLSIFQKNHKRRAKGPVLLHHCSTCYLSNRIARSYFTARGPVS